MNYCRLNEANDSNALQTASFQLVFLMPMGRLAVTLVFDS